MTWPTEGSIAEAYVLICSGDSWHYYIAWAEYIEEFSLILSVSNAAETNKKVLTSYKNSVKRSSETLEYTELVKALARKQVSLNDSHPQIGHDFFHERAKILKYDHATEDFGRSECLLHHDCLE